MLISRDRAKLINAAIYFAANTQFCGKIKLIKLLYLLDFEHFRLTGQSVTGMDYRAMKLGPVPMALFAEWDALEPDFAEAVEIVPERVIDHTRLTVVPKRAFDDGEFTPRELRLMQALAERFHDELSRPLINYTHAELGPWAKIWDGGRGELERIPYTLALSDDDPQREVILTASDELEGIRAAVGRTH